MRYEVVIFSRGSKESSIHSTAKKHVDTLDVMLRAKFRHYAVVGKTTKRFRCKGADIVEVKDQNWKYSIVQTGQSYLVCLVSSELAEMWPMNSRAKAKEAVKLCTELESAKFASDGLRQTSIIALLSEMSGSESGSMSKKTTSTYADIVTETAKWTGGVTGKSSTKSKSKDTDETEWKDSSSDSHSKSKKKSGDSYKPALLKTVRPMRYNCNEYMESMVGKIIFVKSNKSKSWSGCEWEDDQGWWYKTECLQFVKEAIPLPKAKESPVFVKENMERYIGKVIYVVEDIHPSYYNDVINKYSWEKKDLKIKEEHDRQDLESGREKDSKPSRRRKSSDNGSDKGERARHPSPDSVSGSKAQKKTPVLDNGRDEPSGGKPKNKKPLTSGSIARIQSKLLKERSDDELGRPDKSIEEIEMEALSKLALFVQDKLSEFEKKKFDV